MNSNEAPTSEAAQGATGPAFETLTPGNVRRLRLPWLSKFSHETLASHLVENPDMALRAVGTDEYAVAERWRRRDDIASILEAAGRRNKRAVVAELSARLQEWGAQLVLIAEDAWREDPALYSGLGFAMIERIVFFERDLPVRHGRGDVAWEEGLPVLEIARAAPTDIDVLLELDHTSFPWLWWNSRDEMGTYLEMNDVTVFIAAAGGVPVGYASFTMYNGWAHLDRLAVTEAYQGRGYGASQLVFAMRAMQANGARSIGLSTQELNVQSHRLYRRYDFRLRRDFMGIYGRGSLDPQGAPRQG